MCLKLRYVCRLEYDASKGDDVSEELQSRRAQAQRCRQSGIVPSAGIVVFNQIDKKKERKISMQQITELLEALKFKAKTAEEIMKRLDTDKDGFIDEQEWLTGLDKCMDLKVALEDNIDPETGKLKPLITAGKAIFDMLRRQEGAYSIDKKEIGRYLKSLNAVYKPEEPELDAMIEACGADAEGKMSPDEWLVALDTVPKLKAALEADYNANRVRFNSFRSCGQQLSKLMGNLDRLRYRAAAG